MLVDEVNFMRQLASHPHVVRYHDRVIDRRRRTIFIVMEYCAGGDLAAVIRLHRLQRTFFDEPFIWSIVGQVGGALQACHRAGILHRDLKPSNILLGTSHACARLRPCPPPADDDRLQMRTTGAPSSATSAWRASWPTPSNAPGRTSARRRTCRRNRLACVRLALGGAV